MWNDIGLSLSWFSFQTRRHGWKTALQLNTRLLVMVSKRASMATNLALNIFIYSVTWSEKNTSMYYKRSTSFQENNNQNLFKIYSEKPRRGTTGTKESTQRSINSVQRILGRDWSKLELGRWLPPRALECFKVSTLNKTINFYFLSIVKTLFLLRLIWV